MLVIRRRYRIELLVVYRVLPPGYIGAGKILRATVNGFYRGIPRPPVAAFAFGISQPVGNGGTGAGRIRPYIIEIIIPPIGFAPIRIIPGDTVVFQVSSRLLPYFRRQEQRTHLRSLPRGVNCLGICEAKRHCNAVCIYIRYFIAAAKIRSLQHILHSCQLMIPRIVIERFKHVDIIVCQEIPRIRIVCHRRLACRYPCGTVLRYICTLGRIIIRLRLAQQYSFRRLRKKASVCSRCGGRHTLCRHYVIPLKRAVHSDKYPVWMLCMELF